MKRSSHPALDQNEFIAMIESGEYRLAIKKRFLRAPLIVLERRITVQRGYWNGFSYDDIVSHRWIPVTVEIEHPSTSKHIVIPA